MEITPTELGSWLIIGGLVAGSLASVVMAVVWIIKNLVTRFEFNKLSEAVEELKKMSGKLSPEAEEQQIKILSKMSLYLEYLEERQKRDTDRRK